MTATKTPEPTRTRRSGVVIAVIAFVTLVGLAAVFGVIVGLGLLTITSSDGGLAPAPIEAPIPPVPDGEMFAWLAEIGDGTIAVDPAQLLTGQAARDAAQADGVIGSREDLPNDLYIRNSEDESMEIGVDTNVHVEVLTFDDSGAITETSISLGELITAFEGGPELVIYGLVTGEFPVTLTVENGAVVQIEQVYLP